MEGRTHRNYIYTCTYTQPLTCISQRDTKTRASSPIHTHTQNPCHIHNSPHTQNLPSLHTRARARECTRRRVIQAGGGPAVVIRRYISLLWLWRGGNDRLTTATACSQTFITPQHISLAVYLLLG